ncbi:hypothetical protein [Streptomyces sp. NPDC091416]|uniref:DUF7848 domain-containing protein n=1 Tax=Streptomyces sp. NPDC091416 TaxID=3366003 RepID=UPI0038272776
MHEIECTSCLDRSDAAAERTPPEDWALNHTGRHTGRHTGHRSYRAIVTSFIHVTPAPGNPLYEEAP